MSASVPPLTRYPKRTHRRSLLNNGYQSYWRFQRIAENSRPVYDSLVPTLQLLKSSDAQARKRLTRITALDADWTKLGSAPPNEKARELAFRVLEVSYSMGILEPSLVTASADGGVGVVYKNVNKYAAIECLNRGVMQLLWFDQDGMPQSRRLKNTSKAIKEALEQIASLHANA